MDSSDANKLHQSATTQPKVLQAPADIAKSAIKTGAERDQRQG
jgi:hypothetical protein